jgi:hypothetical protein
MFSTMVPPPRESPRSRVERLFDALFSRDGAGGSWLAPLLGAAPRGRARLGELADAPGWLEVPLAVPTQTGRRGAFEYPAAPSRRLLGWFIDHPDQLVWSPEPEATAEMVRLRQALIDDNPPGARARAQDRAHHLLRRSAPLGQAWWRFEEARAVDCLLMTDRLVVVIHAPEGALEPATPWLPRRSALVRDLEAARRFADGGRAWGVLALGDREGSGDGDEDGGADAVAVAAAVRAGAPHLDEAERQQLCAAYLGRLSWEQALTVTGVDPDRPA